MSWVVVAIILSLAIGVCIACEVARRKSFACFAGRSCAGRQWVSQFPNAPADDIRQFLLIVIDAFALRRKHALKFRPDDRVMEIYRALNPPAWSTIDQMELECFAALLKNRYGIAIESVWRQDITLGEVFTVTRSVRSGAEPQVSS